MGGFHLGIDFGTSSTAAVLADPDGRRAPLLLEPSAVCLDSAPHLTAGHDAVCAGRAHPDRFEPYPKRAVDAGSVLLGGVECPVRNLFAAMLSHVATDARRVAGRPMSGVALACPASWERRRQMLLERAAAQVGLAGTLLVPEPVATALYADESGLLAVPDHGTVLVCDVGAGSLDAALVRRDGHTFTVVAARALPEVGGLALDAAIAGHLAGRAARRDAALLEAARTARETLSTEDRTHVLVPWHAAELSRVEFECLARPLLTRAMAAVTAVVAEADVTLSAVVLSGGVGRTPLVAATVEQTLGLSPVVLSGPVVAEGALLADPGLTRPRRRPAATPPPAPDTEPEPEPEPAPDPAKVRSVDRPNSLEPEPERDLSGVRSIDRPNPPAPSPREAESVDRPNSAGASPSEASPSEANPSEARSVDRPNATGAAPEPGVESEQAADAVVVGAEGVPVVRPAAPVDDVPPAVAVLVRCVRRAMHVAPAPAAGEPIVEEPAAEEAFETIAVSPAPRFPAPTLTLADVSRDQQVQQRKKVKKALTTAALTLAASVVAGAAGVVVALQLTGAMPERPLQVGECVAQDEGGTSRVDCGAGGAFQITRQLSWSEPCPDAAQPFVIQGQARFCLAPAQKS
ncbi:Hsp70 family protein [Dactylosporangium sp. AC04546]|uniref:Hsp70 family protein n=1 Tax=Dactylosporangium sp. AC04546 TaxID=2862460 RepID=UPI001EDEE624|nr:Hsp70 family protein [Dactylosporangium sp. AC04546]WVK87923.1 Hsp70 family protein [Dactylosporangium sp. AC04546]